MSSIADLNKQSALECILKPETILKKAIGIIVSFLSHRENNID